MRRAVFLVFLLAGAAGAATPFDGALPPGRCAGWQGRPVCAVLDEDAQTRVMRCVFPPGVGHEPHYHPPHFGYVLEGEGVMRITTPAGVVERALKAGDTWTSATEVRHAAVNISDRTLSYLLVEKKHADTRPPAQVAQGFCR
jgi:quercetin dioxygenase-like cupin family protein